MRNLISLIVKNIHWLFFFLLIFISLYLIVAQSHFQRSKYLTIEREIIGRIYSVSDLVTSYIGLKSTNEQLVERLKKLEMQNLYLESYVRNTIDSTEYIQVIEELSNVRYHFISARVSNNNTSSLETLLTLNKGSNDGVKPDMGVFSPQGVVGIVMSTSPNFSIVIPLLSSQSNLSCKVKRSDYQGLLKWDGKDSQFIDLEGLPRHAKFNIGDTIVTSGYSSVFPEGLRIGTVVDSYKQNDDDFISLKVKLFADFSTLSEVIIVENVLQKEQQELEQTAQKRVLKGLK